MSSNSSAAPAGVATTTPTTDALALVARLLFGYFFIPAGIGKIMGFAGTAGYIASVGLPMASLGAVLAIVVEVGGGLAVLLGFKTRIAALVLAVFTLAASVFFHAYWAAPEAQKMVAQLLFNKNLAVIGGLLLLAAFGPGRFSLDKR